MKTEESISKHTHAEESLPPFLEMIRQQADGLKVPGGYFDSLSPRIVDGINHHEKRSFLKATVPAFRKPVIWGPAFATLLVAVLLIFVIPSRKDSPVQVIDEWTELNMAYDASYAEDVILAEGQIIDSEIAKTDDNFIINASLNGANEPSDEEIAKYLKEHEIDTDILIAN